MGKLKLFDMYRELTKEEVTLGGDILKGLVRRKEDLEIVYYRTSIGDYELKNGIENRLFLNRGFTTNAAIAPLTSLFELEKMNGFLDSLVDDLVHHEKSRLLHKKKFGLFGTKLQDMGISRAELWIAEPIGYYEIKATFLSKDIADILSDEFDQVYADGGIFNFLKIRIYPDIKVAERAYPYFDDTLIGVNLVDKVYTL